MVPVGSRVGAIIDANPETKVVRLCGYGVYEGNETPPDNAGGVALFAKLFGMGNPKIKLDNGKIVWGCECWWASEEKIKAEIEKYKEAGFTIEEVDIDELRGVQEEGKDDGTQDE